MAIPTFSSVNEAVNYSIENNEGQQQDSIRRQLGSEGGKQYVQALDKYKQYRNRDTTYSSFANTFSSVQESPSSIINTVQESTQMSLGEQARKDVLNQYSKTGQVQVYRFPSGQISFAEPTTPMQTQSTITQPFSFANPQQSFQSQPQAQEQFNVFSKAPTTREKIYNIAQTQNPFTGLYGFGVERSFGKLADVSRTQKGQNIFAGETGERLKTGVEILPFVFPPTAPIFLFGSALGQFAPGGQVEAERFGAEIELRTGGKVSKEVGEGGVYAFAIAGGFIGGKGLRSQVDNTFAKMDTKFLATSQKTGSFGDIDFVTTKTGAVTTRKGLFSDRVFYSGAKTDIKLEKGVGLPRNVGEFKVSPRGEDLFSFQATTTGKIREVKPVLNFPKSEVSFAQPKTALELGTGRLKFKDKALQFYSIAVGEGRSKQLFNVVSESQGLKAGREVEGFDFSALGYSSIQKTAKVSQKGKPIRKFTEPQGFVSFGRAGLIDENLLFSISKSKGFKETLFRGIKYPRKLRGQEKGLIKIADETEKNILPIFTRTGTKTQGKIKSIAEPLSQIQGKQSIEINIKDLIKSETRKTTLGAVRLGGTSQVSQLPLMVGGGGKGNSLFAGQGVSEIEFVSSPLTLTMPQTKGRLGFSTDVILQEKGRERLGFGLASGLLQSEKQETKLRNIQQELLATSPLQRQQQRVIQTQSQMQRQQQRQTQRQDTGDFFDTGISRSQSKFRTPIAPVFFLPEPFPKAKARKTKEKKRKYRRTVSLVAVELGLTDVAERREEESGLIDRRYIVRSKGQGASLQPSKKKRKQNQSFL